MKQHTPATAITSTSHGKFPLETFFSVLEQVKDVPQWELHHKRLQFLAQHFDPFVPNNSPEVSQIIEFYQLTDTIQDPFHFTNTILQMLDALDERKRSMLSA